MPDGHRDPARPDQLRQASRDTETAAESLDDSLRWNQAATSGFASQPLHGGTAGRFGDTLGSINGYLTVARGAHEQVAKALRRVADPIEEEQQARERQQEARKTVDQARERLDAARAELEAAQSELTCAQNTVAGAQARIAQAQQANLARAALGQDPLPVDTSGLHAAQRQVAQAEKKVRAAEQVVSRATDRLEQARERLDRARRAHQRADDARDRAIRSFTSLLQFMGVLPPLPMLPGASPTPAGGQRSLDDLIRLLPLLLTAPKLKVDLIRRAADLYPDVVGDTAARRTQALSRFITVLNRAALGYQLARGLLDPNRSLGQRAADAAATGGTAAAGNQLTKLISKAKHLRALTAASGVGLAYTVLDLKFGITDRVANGIVDAGGKAVDIGEDTVDTFKDTVSSRGRNLEEGWDAIKGVFGG